MWVLYSEDLIKVCGFRQGTTVSHKASEIVFLVFLKAVQRVEWSNGVYSSQKQTWRFRRQGFFAV